MSNGVFVTGTDTGAGKTLIASALIHAWVEQGLRVAGMKPVATGAVDQGAGLRNDDALQLCAAANVAAQYAEINPYVFGPAIAPHLAAADAGCEITLAPVLDNYAALAARSDRVVVEGVGGWRVPLADELTTVDLACALGLPVVLVVHLRLGCLNHALLTAQAVAHSGLLLAGWIANQASAGMERVQDNIAALQRRIPAPLIGSIVHMPEPRAHVISSALNTRILDQELALGKP